MAFKLIERNTVPVTVKGKIADENGKTEIFDFTLTCKRMGADALQDALKTEDRNIKSFMADVVEGWKGVHDATGAAVDFTAEALDQLLDVPGIAGLAFKAFLEEQGARAKN